MLSAKARHSSGFATGKMDTAKVSTSTPPLEGGPGAKFSYAGRVLSIRSGTADPRLKSRLSCRPYGARVQQRHRLQAPPSDRHRPLTCLSDRQRPRRREFASSGSGVQIPSAPHFPRSKAGFNVEPALWVSAQHESTATLAIKLPAEPFERASSLGRRDLAVDLHRRGGLAAEGSAWRPGSARPGRPGVRRTCAGLGLAGIAISRRQPRPPGSIDVGWHGLPWRAGLR